ncbi:MAG TPA: MDR family MFS transporter [Symbiobacteriaceae bacterium]|nr:MDR family MFS transporter [Symbiobacteriaceae bacterium]
MKEDRSKLLVTAGLLVGLLVAALDQTIVDTAFPRMIADLHGESIFTWVLTAYMLASTSIVPVVGKLADIYGRKVFYLAGLALFVGGSMLCGASQSMTQLIIFRSLQGVGGGMLMPIAFTIVGDLFPGEQRAKMQGVFGAAWGLASIIGPKLGGWITHTYSWRWIFYVNLPVGIIAFVLMSLYYKESRGERRPIDWLGSVTVTAGIVLFLLALTQGGNGWAWSSWQSVTLFSAAAALLIAFTIIETRVEEPVLDLSLFKNRTFTVMSSVGFLMGAGMFGAVVFVPWFIQGVVGVDPNQAGSVMTPMMMTVVIFSVLAGRLALKLPYRYQITAGFLLVAVGFLTMTRWSVETTKLQATISTMIVGAGLGMMMPILTLAVQNAFPASRRGVVTSATTFFRSVGGTVGVAVFGVIFNGQMSQRFQETLAPKMAQMAPMLAQLPPQAQEFFKQVASNPQALIRVLLSEEAQKAIPAQFAPQFIGGIKLMMAESLHVVFWTSIAVVVVGLVSAQFLGGTSLKQQAKENGGEMVTETPAIAD